MNRDPGDIFDRYSIATLKKERIGASENVAELILFEHGYNHFVQTHCRLSEADWMALFEEIYNINSQIWDAESAIRQGQLDNDLEEAGKSAIKVRKLNTKRISLKNKINSMVNERILDVKQSHVSEG